MFTQKDQVSEVFKVVRVINKRWWSANLNSVVDSCMPQNPDAAYRKRYNIVEYQLNQITKPLPHLKRIFVCPDLTNAKRAARSYSGDMLILKGFGPNREDFKPQAPIMYKAGSFRLPEEFYSSTVDWFVPLEIVK